MWHLEQQSGITIVTLAIDQLNEIRVGEFQTRLATLTKTSQRVIFDLSRVDFLDSSGLGALVLAHRRLKDGGGDLCLCAPTPAVRAIFDLVCLGKAITITPTREEALESLGALPRLPETAPAPRRHSPGVRRAAPNA